MVLNVVEPLKFYIIMHRRGIRKNDYTETKPTPVYVVGTTFELNRRGIDGTAKIRQTFWMEAFDRQWLDLELGAMVLCCSRRNCL